jgi:Fic family protein
MNTGLDNELSFQVEGHTVEIEFKPMTAESIRSIKEQIQKDDFFGAELRAVVGSVDELKVDGKVIMRKRTRAERRGNVSLGEAEGIPDISDEKTDKDLWDYLQREIVARNPRLATRPVLKAAFEQYADEDAPKKDPTPLRDAAKTGS